MIRNLELRIKALEKSACMGNPIYGVKFVNGLHDTMSLLSVLLYCVDRPDILNGRGGIDCYIGNDRILSISYQLGNRTLKADALKILEEYIGRSQKLIDAGTKFISPYPSGNAFQ